MNSLLPYSLKDTPEHIFATVQEGIFERQLMDRVLLSIQCAQNLDEQTRLRLAWRSELLAELIEAGVLSIDEQRRLVATPIQAMNVVHFRPYLLPLWQDLILSDAEAAEQLARLYLGRCRKLGIKLPDGLLEQVLQSLQSDPVRYLRVLKILDQNAWAEANKEAIESSEERRAENASWALLWVANHTIADDKPLDADVVEALSKDEGFAYLAMRILRDRVLSPEVWAPLENAIVTPRWAYHVLRDGLMLDREDEAKDILRNHPGWLVEWLVDSGATPTTIATNYKMCAKEAFAHELVCDLHHWHKTTTLIRSLRRPNQLAAAAS